ncbi:hypothetical protein BST61_g10304 [Cercospora zeina]
MTTSAKWTDAEFHCEQLLREEFGVETSGDGIRIAHDMMGRLFGSLYCWTQHFKKSQPKRWDSVCNGPYTLEEQYLRVHLRESIKAAADLEGNTNLLTDQPNRRILLARHDLPARYALPRRPVQMIHTDHLQPAQPDELRDAKYKPVDSIHPFRAAFQRGGHIISVETLDGPVFDAMVCDAPYCYVCTADFLPPAEKSPFEGRPFLHLWRDCEPGEFNSLGHHYMFNGTTAGEVVGVEDMVPEEKQEVDVCFLDRVFFVDRVLACVPENCEVCQAYSKAWVEDNEDE